MSAPKSTPKKPITTQGLKRRVYGFLAENGIRIDKKSPVDGCLTNLLRTAAHVANDVQDSAEEGRQFADKVRDRVHKATAPKR